MYKPKSDEIPRVIGDTAWEYVVKHRGIKRFFKRPQIRYIHGFTYWHKGQYPVAVPKGDLSDTHTIPWPFVLASLGFFFDYAMKGMTWPSGVHDEACEKGLYNPDMRAEIYRESIWLAFHELEEKIDREERGWWRRKSWIALAYLRNYLLVGGVKAASKLRLAC